MYTNVWAGVRPCKIRVSCIAYSALVAPQSKHNISFLDPPQSFVLLFYRTRPNGLLENALKEYEDTNE